MYPKDVVKVGHGIAQVTWMLGESRHGWGRDSVTRRDSIRMNSPFI